VRYVAIWMGIDPSIGVASTRVSGLSFKKGVPEDVDRDTANSLSKVQGFVVLRSPSTFFEVIKNTILPVKE